MTTLSDTQIGICTVCTTVHVSETDMHDVQECENCGEKRVYSIDTMCDMVNEYLDTKNFDDDESLYHD